MSMIRRAQFALNNKVRVVHLTVPYLLSYVNPNDLIHILDYIWD